jgi:hypothetical protein
MGGEDTQLQTVVNPRRQTAERRRTASPKPVPSNVRPTRTSGITGPPVKGSEPELWETAVVVVVIGAAGMVVPGEHAFTSLAGHTIGSVVVVEDSPATVVDVTPTGAVVVVVGASVVVVVGATVVVVVLDATVVVVVVGATVVVVVVVGATVVVVVVVGATVVVVVVGATVVVVVVGATVVVVVAGATVVVVVVGATVVDVVVDVLVVLVDVVVVDVLVVVVVEVEVVPLPRIGSKVIWNTVFPVSFGSPSAVFTSAANVLQPAGAGLVGTAGVWNPPSTIIAVPLFLSYGVPVRPRPLAPETRCSVLGPTGHAGNAAGLMPAVTTLRLPSSTTAPVSGSMLPVQSVVASGVI